MAKDLNKVMIIGRLGTEPDMRHTSSGNVVTTFRVASCRQWKDSNGELHEETEWFSVVTWNKLAEICHQHLNKSTRVYLEGRLQTRSWEDPQSGQMRYKTEIVAHDMIILDNRVVRDASLASDAHTTHTHTNGTDINHNTNGMHTNGHRTLTEDIIEPDECLRPFLRSHYTDDLLTPPLDIGDDDIPF